MPKETITISKAFPIAQAKNNITRCNHRSSRLKHMLSPRLDRRQLTGLTGDTREGGANSEGVLPSRYQWRSKYVHVMMRRGRKIAKVAMARRLAVALDWMWRKGWKLRAVQEFGSHAGPVGTGDGVESNTE